MAAPADVKDRLRESYNAMATEYNAWTQRHDQFRLAYLDHLIAATSGLSSPAPDDKPEVLELGCGNGDPFLKTLLTRVPAVRAHANDMSDTQIDLARKSVAAFVDRATFYPGDMTKLSFAPGSLTAAVALYSIIHLAQDEQKDMFRKIGTWLKPGGCLLATVGLEASDGTTLDSWIHEKGWMYWSGLGKEKTLETIQSNGFEMVKAEVEGDSEEKFLWIIARKT